MIKWLEKVTNKGVLEGMGEKKSQLDWSYFKKILPSS